MSFLERVASTQYRFATAIIFIVFIITLFLGAGIANIGMQSDISKEMPQDLPIIKLNKKVTDKFGGQDTIILLIQADENSDARPDDIRSAKISQYLIDLEESFSHSTTVSNTFSAADYYKQLPELDDESILTMFDQYQGINDFYSPDYTSTVLYIQANVGSSEEKIIGLTELIEQKVSETDTPAGIRTSVAGNPPLQVTMLNILWDDAIFTLSLSSLLILILLFIMEKSIKKGLLVFIPLMLGLIWTLGSMGWLDIKLSVATVGVGAMILGLGVEYGVFMLTRYKEERKKGTSQMDAVKIAVPSVGTSVLGSGTTTIIGFLSLTLSITPMLQHLGQTLALGIFFSLVAAVFVAPAIIILEERLDEQLKERQYQKLRRSRA